MKDEIKKILDRLENIDHKEYSCSFEFADTATFTETARCFEERKKMANYITNLQEENESLKEIAKLRKDTLIMNQKKVDNLQERIDKAIKLLKEAGCYEEDTKIFCSDIYHELPELLNILTGGDEDE